MSHMRSFVYVVALFALLVQSVAYTEAVDTFFVDVEMVEVNFENLVLQEGNFMMMDPASEEWIQLVGVVNQAGVTYALIGPQPKTALPCGHGYGCRKCQGCNKPGCAWYCPGCPRP